jgi:Flp pilus assembly protein TadG
MPGGVRRRGQGLVELALVLPILLLLLAVAVDVGRWLEASHRLNRAVTDGARYGAVKDVDRASYPTSDQVRSHVQAVLAADLRGSEILVNTAAQVAEEPAVSVRAECSFATFTPGLTGIRTLRLVAESWFPRR